MKLLFWLYKAKKNKKGLMPIMMRITLNDQRINFPTQITIEEKAWVQDKQLIKDSGELSQKYNQYLLNLKTKAWEVHNDSRKNDEPITAHKIKEYILGNDASTYTLLEALDYHIGSLRARVGHDIAPATVKKYETCKRKVGEFLQQERRVICFFILSTVQFILISNTYELKNELIILRRRIQSVNTERQVISTRWCHPRYIYSSELETMAALYKMIARHLTFKNNSF